MQKDCLRLRLEFQLPLRAHLHSMHGFQSHCLSHEDLAELRMDLPLDQQMGHRATQLGLEFVTVRTRSNPVWGRADTNAIPRYREGITDVGQPGIHRRDLYKARGVYFQFQKSPAL